jgi:hypothetical protein
MIVIEGINVAILILVTSVVTIAICRFVRQLFELWRR